MNNDNRNKDIILKKSSNKKNIFHIWLDFKSVLFDYNYFLSEIINHTHFNRNIRYSVLCKVEKDDMYRTIMPAQLVFCSNNLSDLKSIHSMLGDVITKFQEQYNTLAISNPDSLILSFFAITVEEKYLLTDKMKDMLKVSEYNKISIELNLFDYTILDKLWDNPQINLNKNLKKLNWDQENTKFLGADIDSLFSNFNFVSFNKYINKYCLDKNLYLLWYSGRYYVILNMKLNSTEYLRVGFNENGSKIYEVTDTYSDKNVLVKRISGNFIYSYDNKKISFIERKIKLLPIKYIDKDQTLDLPNQTFGVLDLETFINKSSLARAYAAGFYVHDNKEENYFYIDKDLDSFKLIHRCISALILDKNKNKIFYVHNLGNYDSIFIIKALSVINKTLDNPYSFSMVDRDGSILKLRIKRFIDNKVRQLTLVDSFAMTPLSLRDLGKAYKVNILKGEFPYPFVNEETLWYKGKTPAKSYYRSELSDKDYNQLVKDDWQLMYETIKYLQLDLKTLHEILRVINLNIFMMFDVQMTESITSASLSLKILFSKFADPKLIIPQIQKK